jgi:hypothetical protein
MKRLLIALLLIPSLALATVPVNFGNNLVKAAEHYKNVRESKGDNRSPEIDSFLKDLGLPVGLAWCLAYVQRCWKDACAEVGIKNPMPKGCARVSVFLKIAEQNPYVWKVKSYKSISLGATTPAKGNMPIFINGPVVGYSENFNGHVGILDVPLKGSFWGWEGNTGPEVAHKSSVHLTAKQIEAERNAGGATAGVHYRYRGYNPQSRFRVAYLIEARS